MESVDLQLGCLLQYTSSRMSVQVQVQNRKAENSKSRKMYFTKTNDEMASIDMCCCRVALQPTACGKVGEGC